MPEHCRNGSGLRTFGSATHPAEQSSRFFVQMGAYKGCCFYRAEPNFVLQGGLSGVDGQKKPYPFANRPVPLEYSLPNVRGSVTLARWEKPESGTSEFFINLKDNPHLDRTGGSGWALGFAVWGEVVEGLSVAEEIVKGQTQVKGGLKMLVKPVEFQAQLC